MAVTEILVFGFYRDGLMRWIDTAQDICDNRGVDYNGPHPLPNVSVAQLNAKVSPNQSLEIVHDWFRGVELKQEESDIIQKTLSPNKEHKPLFGRLLVISDDETVREVLEIDPSKHTFYRVSVGKQYIPDSTGNTPTGYDPNADYVTDVDYDAHHSN